MKYDFKLVKYFSIHFTLAALLLSCGDKEDDEIVVQDNGEMTVTIGDNRYTTSKILATHLIESNILNITGYFDSEDVIVGMQLVDENSDWDDGAYYDSALSFVSFLSFTYNAESPKYTGIANTGTLLITDEVESDDISYSGNFSFNTTNLEASVDGIVSGEANQFVQGSFSDIMVNSQ